MARQKNALRKHYVAAFDSAHATTAPEKENYKLLAKYIKTVNDETDEDTDDVAWYDGDGTPEESVISVKAGYSFEGNYDVEDPAQKLIAGLRYKVGDERKVWFKVVSSDNKTQWEAVAIVSGIKAGDGDANEFENFECTIKWVTLPKETAIV
nr:MAG TPA: tail tube protein [Caudoviricetes sp.]